MMRLSTESLGFRNFLADILLAAHDGPSGAPEKTPLVASQHNLEFVIDCCIIEVDFYKCDRAIFITPNAGLLENGNRAQSTVVAKAFECAPGQALARC
jgi:hypothetical protein